MWRCTNCGQELPEYIETCWVCTNPKYGSQAHVDNSRASQATQHSAGSGPQRSSLATQLGIAGLNKRTVIAVGIVIAIIGVGVIIISPNLLFVEHSSSGPNDIFGMGIERTTDLRSVALFLGVALLIVGGIVSAVGFSQFKSTQLATPPAPIIQHTVTQSLSPKSVELGNTPDEVQSVMGQPDKIIDLGPRVIHVYKDMKIIYVDGKVSDVQLS